MLTQIMATLISTSACPFSINNYRWQGRGIMFRTLAVCEEVLCDSGCLFTAGSEAGGSGPPTCPLGRLILA